MSEKPAALSKLDFLFKDAKTTFWVAGGCFIGIVTGSRIKDIDVFAPDPTAVIDEFKLRGYREGFENSWVKNFKHERLIIQVIKKYVYETQQKTIDDFDFTIVSAAYDGKDFIAHERFYLDVAQRRIVITNLRKLLNTLKRALKYASRGFVMCPVALSRLAKEINLLKIDWENPDQNVIDFYPDGTPTFWRDRLTPTQIRALRKRLKLSPEAFAAALSFAGPHARINVWRWETGARKPSAQTVALMKQLTANNSW